ncbi:transcription-repair coupling factor [Micrococcales bacterium 31B]|nr:transcription-repair coupling factor [Micrococcales bacterium 31B]
MKLDGLLHALESHSPHLAEPFLEALTAGQAEAQARPLIAPAGIRPPLLAAAARSLAGRTLLVVTATGNQAEDLQRALDSYLEPHDTAYFPAWETLPHERLSPRSDTVAQRLTVLRRLVNPDPSTPATSRPRIVLAPVRAVLQPLVKGLGELEPVELRAQDDASLETVVERLVDAAYTRVDMVERRGEFAVRGGILDVFPPNEPHPLRIDFWGDTVEEIRYFAVADQRSLEIAENGLWAAPCRELLLTPAVRERARGLLERMPGNADMLTALSEGIAVEGMESIAPALVDGMELLLDLVPATTSLCFIEPERIAARAEDLTATTDEFLQAAWAGAAAGGEIPVEVQRANFLTLAQLDGVADTLGLPRAALASFGLDDAAADLASAAIPDAAGRAGSATDPGSAAAEASASHAATALPARPVRGYAGVIREAIADLARLTREGWRLVLTTDGPGTAKRMSESLSDEGITAVLVGQLPHELEPGNVYVTTSSHGAGFVIEALKLALLTESDITGKSGPTTRDMRKMPSKRRTVVDPLQLKKGDFVVHEHHGVGKFVEMTQRTVGSGKGATTREYLVIEYASSKRGQPGDRLYVPSDALDQVTRYVGGEAPALSKMGGGDWAKTKQKARKAVKEIAGELVRLYAARQASKGFAFSADTTWQRELEDAFPYSETPDQLATIDEVKRDMERDLPMDRLICGDVGYGKTEIAVRAAFKAVQDGKQVAILVPTTLLAQQHFETFSERYAGFPVEVRALSRFQSDKDSKQTIDDLLEGKVDVLIGTHRILSTGVRFKNLGLVIIDEEQRFGVEHKEALKGMRANVDVLAMSATPIPRTLEMAVTGLREMSTLATPPEERHPVLTYVGAWESKQIAAAVKREIMRDGQVFYVHNRVESITATAARLQELVPNARIAVAHGRMSESQLERVIVDFWEKRFDVLVSTTIIETGLDIANANTLIVERADAFGLSQLHQLRGRVGRGRERAYAYFLYPPEKPLTETAHDRLSTINIHRDLGAGMQVAMKDLEIRGAGNLLGGEQSGHIAGVGFDLYIRMVGEAVANYKGEAPEETPEVRIDLPVDAHLPHDYVGSERLRLEIYGKLSQAANEGVIEEVRDELLDRYGPLPGPVEVLLDVAKFRVEVRAAGLAEVVAMGSTVRFGPLQLPDSASLRLRRLYPGAAEKHALRIVTVPRPTTARIGGEALRDHDVLTWARAFIASIVRGEVSASAAVAAAQTTTGRNVSTARSTRGF